MNEIFKFEEAAQIDPDPEQLNEIFEVEEAAQKDPESEQRINGFPEYHRELIKPRLTLYRLPFLKKSER